MPLTVPTTLTGLMFALACDLAASAIFFGMVLPILAFLMWASGVIANVT